MLARFGIVDTPWRFSYWPIIFWCLFYYKTPPPTVVERFGFIIQNLGTRLVFLYSQTCQDLRYGGLAVTSRDDVIDGRRCSHRWRHWWRHVQVLYKGVGLGFWAMDILRQAFVLKPGKTNMALFFVQHFSPWIESSLLHFNLNAM
jgi:hypothetical protein